VLVASIVVAETPGAASHGPATSNPKHMASKTVGQLHIESFGASGALFWVSQEAHVPIGVEAIFDHDKEPTIDFDFAGGTIADLLNIIVSQAPEYRWIEEDRIIHAFWNSTHLPIADVVMSYPGAKNKTRKEIWDDIDKRPEITAWLEANHCERQELLTGKEFSAHNAPISIEAGSMTLVQLLDQTAIKSGENYWAIVQSATDKPCQVSILLW